jgi:hypothetical protein
MVHTTADHQPNALIGAGSLWWALDALYRGLPPWSAVPPILVGLAALWNARTAARRLRLEAAERMGGR